MDGILILVGLLLGSLLLVLGPTITLLRRATKRWPMVLVGWAVGPGLGAVLAHRLAVSLEYGKPGWDHGALGGGKLWWALMTIMFIVPVASILCAAVLKAVTPAK